MPSNPVICKICGQKRAASKDRFCHGCRIKSRPNPAKRFFWNEDLDNRLRTAYRAASRTELTCNLDDLERSTGFTRFVILSRTAELNLSSGRLRRWSSAELEFLSDSLGELSIAAIARRLSRTYYSVKAKVRSLQFSARVTGGYSQRDVVELFGVGRKTVLAWIARGWLEVVNERIPEESLARFVRRHPEEYRLSRVDETWFKGTLFPGFALEVERKGVRQKSIAMAAVDFSTSELESIANR